MKVHPQESSMVWGLLGESGWDGEDVSEEDSWTSSDHLACPTDHYC